MTDILVIVRHPGINEEKEKAHARNIYISIFNNKL